MITPTSSTPVGTGDICLVVGCVRPVPEEISILCAEHDDDWDGTNLPLESYLYGVEIGAQP
jgi:hypothetical protein